MGKKLDALLGRKFKTAKFKSLLNLTITRCSVLKNQRQIRCSVARSDVSQLLTLNHHERALLRVEQVIKEQNMFDVFVMIEGYCNLLIERVVMIENNKECPEELKEAMSSLIFAASRCGEFPELKEIREIFMARFGKEFVARAVELRSNCGVNPKIIQKMSTLQPSLESRMKVLQEIASQNGISLHLEEVEAPSSINKEPLEMNQSKNQAEPTTWATMDHVKHGDKIHSLSEEIDKDERFSGSMETRKKYKDVASAAQAAFESAAYAAAAARAAMELSRSDSQDPDNQNSPNPRPSPRIEKNEPLKPETPRTFNGGLAFEKNESLKPETPRNSNSGLAFEKIHIIENSSSESEVEEMVENKFKDWKNKPELERSPLPSSLNLGKEIVFDDSDDEIRNEFPKMRDFSRDTDKNLTNENERIKLKMGFEEQVPVQKLNIETKPISVRTRRVYGR